MVAWMTGVLAIGDCLKERDRIQSVSGAIRAPHRLCLSGTLKALRDDCLGDGRYCDHIHQVRSQTASNEPLKQGNPSVLPCLDKFLSGAIASRQWLRVEKCDLNHRSVSISFSLVRSRVGRS